MKTEKLIFHNCREWQIIKKLCETFPDTGIPILSAAFIIETVDLGNLPRFMVAPQDGDPVFMPDFESNEESNCLHTVVS